MKIFVCVKQVPDTETKIKIGPDGASIDTATIKWVMNPYDEFAVDQRSEQERCCEQLSPWVPTKVS